MAWHRRTANGLYDLFQTPVSAHGRVGTRFERGIRPPRHAHVVVRRRGDGGAFGHRSQHAQSARLRIGTGQAIAVSGGSALVAWCTGVQGPNGIFVQPVNPATAAPAGAARSQRLAGGSAFKPDVAAAASPRSKASVWVGWVDESGNIVLRRSNATAAVFGAPVTVPGPRDGSSVGLDLNAQTDRVDLVARVQHGDGSVGLEHAQSFPGT